LCGGQFARHGGREGTGARAAGRIHVNLTQEVGGPTGSIGQAAVVQLSLRRTELQLQGTHSTHDGSVASDLSAQDRQSSSEHALAVAVLTFAWCLTALSLSAPSAPCAAAAMCVGVACMPVVALWRRAVQKRAEQRGVGSAADQAVQRRDQKAQ
jgi:hypothetical protein